MTVQITIRIGDEQARFVDEVSAAGEGSRAEVISRALAREMRRRAAAADAAIYLAYRDPELDSDAYRAWAAGNAVSVASDLD